LGKLVWCWVLVGRGGDAGVGWDWCVMGGVRWGVVVWGGMGGEGKSERVGGEGAEWRRWVNVEWGLCYLLKR